jgi:hypothetical protein
LVNALEERLRRELWAESEEITPDSVADLRLPTQAQPGHTRRTLRRRGTQHWQPWQQWRAWAKPLAAAAAVVAVTVGTVALVRGIPGTSTAAGPYGVYASAPVYYAHGVSKNFVYRPAPGEPRASFEVSGRYAEVRSTATGKLLTTVSPPGPYNDLVRFTASADGGVFVFAAVRFTLQRLAALGEGQGHSLRKDSLGWAIDRAAPVKFLMLSITPGGGTQLTALPVSIPFGNVHAAQPFSIALSPDGSRLAVAYGGDGQTVVVQVITLATDARRQWTQPHASWIPVIEGQGAWTADGRTLAFEERQSGAAAKGADKPLGSTQVRLLDTLVPGTSLAAGELLALHEPAGESPGYTYFLTPDGTELITSVDADLPGLARYTGGELAVYSARTGALLATLAPWKSARPGYYEQFVVWSNFPGTQLIVLQPHNRRYALGVLTANTFTSAGTALLPRAPPAYRSLENAIADSPGMTW